MGLPDRAERAHARLFSHRQPEHHGQSARAVRADGRGTGVLQPQNVGQGARHLQHGHDVYVLHLHVLQGRVGRPCGRGTRVRDFP